MFDNKRLGTFRIHISFINNTPDFVKSVLKDVIPIHTFTDYGRDQIVYTGICDKFKEIEPGNVTPVYHPYIENNEIKWVDVDGD